MPGATWKVDNNLFEFCTVKQLEYLEAINKHKGMRPAARALGVNFGTVHGALQQVQKKAAAFRGYSPAHDLIKPTAPGFRPRGHSTLYDFRQPGAPAMLQWVKTKEDDEKREQIVRDAIAALMDDVPRVAPTPAPAIVATRLLNCFTITDAHVGMHAWGKESGEDWDLTIAERTLGGAVNHLIAACPTAAVGVVAQLGDFMHFDGLAAITPTHGHLLDADTRFRKVVDVAVRILRQAVAAVLARHSRVIVLMAEGNHDPVAAVWLSVIFRLLFEQEPRVTVIDSPLPYYVLQHGSTMLGWHHGHLLKNPEQLPLLMAAQFPAIWGATTKRYIHTGHRHHKREIEHPGVHTIQHPTIAARDAYAARGGWISEREMTAITYHDQFGQVARATVTPEMLEPA